MFSPSNLYVGRSKEPSFDESVPHNVSALIGRTAFLTCVVKNLGKTKSVSGRLLRMLRETTKHRKTVVLAYEWEKQLVTFTKYKEVALVVVLKADCHFSQNKYAFLKAGITDDCLEKCPNASRVPSKKGLPRAKKKGRTIFHARFQFRSQNRGPGMQVFITLKRKEKELNLRNWRASFVLSTIVKAEMSQDTT